MGTAVESSSRFVLRDGSVALIRAARPGDRFALLEFLRNLCLDSRASRFLSPCVDLERSAALLADVDGIDRFGLLASAANGSIVGHASYGRVGPSRAEAAVVVADSFHRRGLATILLNVLASEASDRGIDVFVAEVLPDNGAILACIRKSFPLTIRHQPGSSVLESPTRPHARTARALAVVA
jgi:GNAT superfamily N-acetyltransferase